MDLLIDQIWDTLHFGLLLFPTYVLLLFFGQLPDRVISTFFVYTTYRFANSLSGNLHQNLKILVKTDPPNDQK